MICPFNCKNKNNIPELDNAAEHLVIVANASGHIHIHGPFKNEYVIKKMTDILITEMRKRGIDYIPAANQDKE